MKHTQSITAFLGIFTLTTALFALTAGADAPKKTAPHFQRPQVPMSETMNGYALKDFDGFWKQPDKWHFVTVRFRKDTGEMRLTYANDIAWKALQAGGKDYPDGAVFGKIGLMTHEDSAFTSSAVPSGARRYQIMVRDKAKWKDTEGWGYALFDGKGLASAEDQDIASRACYACHALVPERTDVFSEPFHLDVSSNEAMPEPVKEEIPRIEFSTIKTEELPQKLREKLPAGFAEARLVQGKLVLNLFRGTIDEIRPTLVKESLKSGKPAALVSKDGTLFSVVYADPKNSACAMAGGGKGVQIKGFYTTGMLPGKPSEIADHEYCEKK